MKLIVVLLYFSLLPGIALAYIDPGTLNYTLQLIAVAFGGLLLSFQYCMDKIKALIGKLRGISNVEKFSISDQDDPPQD